MSSTVAQTISFKQNYRQLLVALSGGPDSTALLIALTKVAHLYNFSVRACHINHTVRGDEADADARFCYSLCEKLDIDCKVIKLTLQSKSSNGRGHFSENDLRKRRYESLHDFAQEQKIAFIFTAHTLDDQSETIIFRLLRGTALAGLQGIKPCRPLGDNIYVLRPLLEASKEQCQKFLLKQGITACHDSSNADSSYTRNYIRHQIFPAVRKRFPDFNEHLDAMRRIITEEEHLMANLTEQSLNRLEAADKNNWSIDLIKSEPLALQRRLVAAALVSRGIAVTFTRVEKILGLSPNDKAYNLNQYWRVRNINNKLSWQEIRHHKVRENGFC